MKNPGKVILRAIEITLAATFLLPQVFSTPSSAETNSLSISNRFSPLNRKRPVRPETRYIILHTTEGSEVGSLSKVRRYGEAHYFVTTSGHVYRIIDRNRIAAHTGRSMWEGRNNLDNYSVGIEVVGHCDRDITPAQYEALAELVRQLKGLYGIEDRNVLTHSMVAYGRPNRFHPSNHRGRKRCGMIFASPDVRRRLGLHDQPSRDPDVAAGRLKIGDKELNDRLYASVPVQAAGPTPAISALSSEDGTPTSPEAVGGESGVIGPGQNAWSIARDRYDHPDTTYVLPNGNRLRGDQVDDWSRIPAGTRVLLSEEEPEQEFEGFLEIGKDGPSVRDLAGDAFAESTTIYFFPNGLIRTGAELWGAPSLRKLIDNPPEGTRLLVGYTYGGYVRARRSAYYVVGRKWNYPSTFYRLPDGSILSGDEIDEKSIPSRTLIFFQN